MKKVLLAAFRLHHTMSVCTHQSMGLCVRKPDMVLLHDHFMFAEQGMYKEHHMPGLVSPLA